MNSIFTPIDDSVTVSVTTTSQAVALSSAHRARKVLSIATLGGSDTVVYARFGDSSITVSTTNGYPVSSVGQAIGEEKLIGIPHGVTHVAFVVAGSGSNKNIQLTEGDLL